MFVEMVELLLFDAFLHTLSIYPRHNVAVSRFVSPHLASAIRWISEFCRCWRNWFRLKLIDL
ncbi:hypothetical protein ACS0TY_020986 [Phlomoides rotata]